MSGILISFLKNLALLFTLVNFALQKGRCRLTIERHILNVVQYLAVGKMHNDHITIRTLTVLSWLHQMLISTTSTIHWSSKRNIQKVKIFYWRQHTECNNNCQSLTENRSMVNILFGSINFWEFQIFLFSYLVGTKDINFYK